jgi:hypothetical protein
MRRGRTTRARRRAGAGARWRAWVGILALLFYSVLPLAHHARAAPAPSGALPPGVIVYELCTPDGLRLVQVPPALPDGKGDPAHRPYSCPICQTLQHAQAALPAAPWTAPAPIISASPAPPTHSGTVPLRRGHRAPGPRAPPSIA